MKNKLWAFICIISLFNLLSCKKDFLITPPTASIETKEFIDNLRLDGCRRILNGAYINANLQLFNGLNIIYPDLISDNIKPTPGAVSFINQYRWTQIASSDPDIITSNSAVNMNGFWTSAYRVIRSLNIILENVDRFRNDNPADANDIKGQALALRALAHFNLVNVFAQPYGFTNLGSHLGVPYVTLSDYLVFQPRNAVAEVYANIEDDLINAISLLPKTAKSKVYIGGIAAKALLARVYLYLGEYKKANEFALSVCNDIPIMTGINYPGKLFTPLETEALFQLPPVATGINGGAYTTTFAGFYFASGSTQAFFATTDIVSIIKERPADLRNAWFTNQSGNWRVSKYPSAVVAGFPNPANSYYQTIIRSSEMYLTVAECFARLGNESSAIYWLDQIRQRADASAPATTATGTDLLDNIMNERRKELCFEGQRMFDLLRWHKEVNRNDAPNLDAVSLSYPNNKAIAPIPVQDITILGYEQNKGY